MGYSISPLFDNPSSSHRRQAQSGFRSNSTA
jgi:hypothetical protein